MSVVERQQKELDDGRTEFTYGEVLFCYFIPVLNLVNPKPGDVFWDLGCGTGKPVAIAALAFPFLKKSCGVEYLQGLYEASRRIIEESIVSKGQKGGEEIAPV